MFRVEGSGCSIPEIMIATNINGDFKKAYKSILFKPLLNQMPPSILVPHEWEHCKIKAGRWKTKTNWASRLTQLSWALESQSNNPGGQCTMKNTGWFLNLPLGSGLYLSCVLDYFWIKKMELWFHFLQFYIVISMGISAKNLIDLVIIFDSSELHRLKCTGIVLSAMQENCLQGFF